VLDLKKIAVLFLILLLVVLIGCEAHIHKIGVGAKEGKMKQARQWYALWGLAPLNQIDTRDMADDATDYEIKTEKAALDIILNIFTGWITVYSRTITVTK